MPFVKGNVSDRIEEKRQESIEFREAWDSTREEYRLIGENHTNRTCSVNKEQTASYFEN